jgi:hypothetical protein
MRFSKKASLLRKPRQCGKRGALRIVQRKQCLFAVQDRRIATPPIISAYDRTIAQVDPCNVQQRRKGSFVKRFIEQEGNRVALQLGDIPVMVAGLLNRLLDAPTNIRAGRSYGGDVEVQCPSDPFAGGGNPTRRAARSDCLVPPSGSRDKRRRSLPILRRALPPTLRA